MSVHNDEPARHDHLSRKLYADAFAGLAHTCDTPLVIGLYGGWGVGKTSLMAQIRDGLDPGKCATVWFDSWLHQHDEAPALALLQTVVQQLHLGDAGKKLLMTAALAFGSSLLKATTLSIWDVKKIGELYEEEQFQVRDARVRLREHFQRIVDHATDGGRRRLVFFIDDLDRCTAETALTLMEALKLYLNLANCVYFIGVDKRILENSIAHRYGEQAVDEINYLEKIIQLPFTIPPISTESKEAFIANLLPEPLASCTDLLALGLANNPRQVKRFINVLSLNHQLAVRADIPGYDPQVLARLLLVQYWSPDLYQRIVQDPSLFFTIGNSTAPSDPGAAAVHPLLRAVLADPGEATIPLQKYIYLTEIAGVSQTVGSPPAAELPEHPAPSYALPAAAPADQGTWPSLTRLFRRQEQKQRTLLVGGGSAAERFIRLVRRMGYPDLEFVGIVDDDPAKQGMRLHGVPVLGTTDNVPALVRSRRVSMVVIAVAFASREEMARMIDGCGDAGAEVRIVPSLAELLDGKARLDHIRPVGLEDLLGRDFVPDPESGSSSAEFGGRTVLITGGAGAIGAELARQVAKLSPARLVLLDRAETALAATQLELRQSHRELDLRPVIADVTHEAQLEHVFAEHRPDCVFHGATYRDVGLVEQNPLAAIRNNVLGTLYVVRAAAAAGVRQFILLSSAEAVRPSSVAGAASRMAEQIAIGWHELLGSAMDRRAVRFGDVLEGRGSVIAPFRRQLEAGRPIPVSHPQATRYFITVREAGELIRQAAALPELAGKVCTLEMGAPIKIVELAERLVRLAGLLPYSDIPIVFTGLGPGETLRELVSDREATLPTSASKIRSVQTVDPSSDDLRSGIERLTAALASGRQDEALATMAEMVPDRPR